MKQLNKTQVIFLAILGVILVAAITVCAIVLPPVIRSARDYKAMDQATSAHTAFLENGGKDVTGRMLFSVGKRVVALDAGKSLGVFDTAEDAARALLDNPVSNKDESAGAVATPTQSNEQLFVLVPASPTAPRLIETGSFFTPENECVLSETFKNAPNTYEAWIRIPRDARGNQGLILGTYGGEIYPCLGMEIHEGCVPALYFSYEKDNETNLRFNKVHLDTGRWLHLAIVNDVENNTASCYVNGELMETLPAAAPLTDLARPLRLGGDYRQGNKKAFHGEIYSVALYEDARTAEEVNSDMQSCGKDGLLAAWDLSYISESRTVPDVSANGYNLTFPEVWMDEKEPVTDYDFSFVAIGDTQLANVFDKGKFSTLYNWIADNRDEKKIAYVMGLGDITDVNSDAEWKRAEEGYAILDEAGIPYSLVIGNHDSDEKFNRTFNKAPYADTFDGMFGNTIANTYRKIEVEGIKYLILTMDFGARDHVLKWADHIISQNPDYNVIITTHAYLYTDGTTIDKDDSYAPTNTDPKNNNGDDMWEKLIRKHENIVLVICGHECHPQIVCTQTKGDHGNTVTQIMTDHSYVDEVHYYSKREMASMVTMFYFSEGGSRVTVECYSTIFNKFYRPENQFSFTLDVVK